jgi:hypothetical protein
MTADTFFEQRGECVVTLNFVDDRLRGLFVKVWRRLPPADKDRIYAALGDGPRALYVHDVTKANRPTRTYGRTERVGSGIRCHLDYYQLSDVSDRAAAYIAAHELAHIACGHLGAPPALKEDDLSAAGQAEVMRRVPVPSLGSSYLPASEIDHEDEADALAATWGHRRPQTRAACVRKDAPRATHSEWTRTR